MTSQVEPRERGRALTFIGWMLVLFGLSALPFMFIEPAAIRLGQLRFEQMIGALLIVGVLLNIYGYWLRRHSD
jgi:hypothetical protein